MSSRQNKEIHGRKKTWQIHWEPVMQVILKHAVFCVSCDSL